jgi:hypothetical protein
VDSLIQTRGAVSSSTECRRVVDGQLRRIIRYGLITAATQARANRVGGWKGDTVMSNRNGCNWDLMSRKLETSYRRLSSTGIWLIKYHFSIAFMLQGLLALAERQRLRAVPRFTCEF